MVFLLLERKRRLGIGFHVPSPDDFGLNYIEN